MDLIMELMKDTYLLRPETIEKTMGKIWRRYQLLLDDSKNIEELWEARAYLYVIGYLYPEEFGPEAIDRRLKYLREPLTLLEFLEMVDRKKVGKEYKSDPLFVKLEKLYKVIKKYKQLVKNNSYLDEKRFNEKERKLIGNKNDRQIAMGF
jgi:hypothetical protein